MRQSKNENITSETIDCHTITNPHLLRTCKNYYELVSDLQGSMIFKVLYNSKCIDRLREDIMMALQ